MKTPRWHKELYDQAHISETLDSEYFKRFARDEARFIKSALKLQRGMDLLDVPCGAGRHSVEFAKLGLKVTSLDINPECVRFTKRNTRGLGVLVRLGDMKDLRLWRGLFDAVTNLFTSFGYFETDAENEAVLAELVSALKPGGKIALHLINRDWLLRVYRPVSKKIAGSRLDLEARQYDPKSKYVESTRVVLNQKTGRGRSYFHRIRLYSKKEMVAMMRRHGLKDIHVYPSASPEPFTRQLNSHPLYVGTYSGNSPE